MHRLDRRIAKIEARTPPFAASGKQVLLSELDPAVAAVFLARGYDVGQMTLMELDALEAELRRFTE